VAVGAGAALWALRPSGPRAEPPDPSGVTDPEVRAAVDAARGQVLAARRSADAWGRLGMLYLANSFEPEADQCFAEAARLAPDDPRWPYGRGRIALLRDPDNAIPLLRSAAAAAGPKSVYGPVVRLYLAEALLERGQLDEAEQLFRAEASQSDYRHRAAYGLGLVALARDDSAAATGHLERALPNPTVRVKVAAQLAALARARGDGQSAAHYERLAAEVAPAPPWADPFVGEVADLQLGPAGARARAERLGGAGRHTEAAEVLLKLARAHPSGRAFTEAGFEYTRAGDIDRAMPLLEEAVRLEPDNAQARYNLALTIFVRVEKENLTAPGSDAVRNGFAEVVRHASRAAELKPDHAMAYLFWGLSLKHLGRVRDAIEPLRKGVAARPEEFELQLALGEVLLATDQRAEARGHLENARRLDPSDPRPARLLVDIR
jgi:tetratricopeptide (TPR) repeat protein